MAARWRQMRRRVSGIEYCIPKQFKNVSASFSVVSFVVVVRMRSTCTFSCCRAHDARTDAETDTVSQAHTKSDAKPNAETVAIANTRTDTEIDASANTETIAGTDASTNAKADTRADAEAIAKSHASTNT